MQGMEQDGSSELVPTLQTVLLSEGSGELDQATFFRSIEEGDTQLLHILLRRRNLDINAYNEQGMTGMHLAVCRYEATRKLDIVETLIKYGAHVCLRAASRPQANKISFVRHDTRHPHTDSLLETKKINVDQKTPLLLALELKSALYLRGWEYRHWDLLLTVLSTATCKYYAGKGIHEHADTSDVSTVIRQGWNDVFQSGQHDVVEVCAEGQTLNALRLLLTNGSKILKSNIENLALSHSHVLEMKDVSFNVVRTVLRFLYTGIIDPDFMNHRGVDLLLAAHKYGVESLKKVCEEKIIPTQEEWIKLYTAALDSESEVLILKCARSIKEVMEKRRETTHILKHSFSDHYAGPCQLFHDKSEN